MLRPCHSPFAFLVLAGLTGLAQAAPITDQVFGPPGGSRSDNYGVGSAVDQEAAQTFTVGVTGTLATVSLQLGPFQGPGQPAQPIAPLQVDITRTVSGAPSLSASDVLGTVFVPFAALSEAPANPLVLGRIVTVDFSASHVAVTAGQQLAIVLRPYVGSAGSGELVYIAWGDRSTSGLPMYGGGEAFLRNTSAPWQKASGGVAGVQWDAFFATTVTVPEPRAHAALALLLLAAARGRSDAKRGD
jgi:hypothetical protein